jgi:hypothetical protein
VLNRLSKKRLVYNDGRSVLAPLSHHPRTRLLLWKKRDENESEGNDYLYPLWHECQHYLTSPRLTITVSTGWLKRVSHVHHLWTSTHVMPVNPKQIKSSVDHWTSPYAASSRSEDECAPSTLLHRRLGDTKHIELLSGSGLYATPWDVNTPEFGHEFIRGPLLPPKDGYPSDDDPLLQAVDYRDQDTPDFKRVRFSELDLAATTFTEENPIIDEFGSAPSSANSGTEFVRHLGTRSALKNRRNNSIWIPGSHPWWPDYEPVHWPPLLYLLVALPVTVFLLWVASLIAHNRSIFWTRSIIAVATSVLGKYDHSSSYYH